MKRMSQILATRSARALSMGALFVFMSSSALGQGYSFTNQTSTRLPVPPNDPALSISDPEEKDFAWGDLNNDGTIDLVVARKQPLSTPGRRRNVLFMNENGVFIDRTEEYATAADDGGNGFRDLTNDRDIAMADVNNDGWLDVITATTYGQGLPKTISHPRIYMNLGEIDGQWQGLRYEEARIPEFAGAPNFCGVAVGDVTGDGFVDLYFIDYDSGGFNSPLEDRLLINIGNGFFIDQTESRMTSGMVASAFGIHAEIVDMNNDGWNDIIKSQNGPVHIAYNGGSGFFNAYEQVYNGASYFASTGDLNNDGMLDIVISDDGIDRYLLNQGNGGDGLANFTSFTFPGSTSGFGSNSYIVDLDNNGFNEVLIADFDVDAGSCNGLADVLRSNENPPIPTFFDDAGGISSSALSGVHDLGIFDIDGDCWLDIVIGRCGGITVWINQNPGNACVGQCTGDINGDETVDTADLLDLFADWGHSPGSAADFDGDGAVGTQDLLILFANWGPCGK